MIYYVTDLSTSWEDRILYSARVGEIIEKIISIRSRAVKNTKVGEQSEGSAT